MADDELRNAKKGDTQDGEGRQEPDSDLLRRLAQASSLPGQIQKRYMEMGRQLLADEVPRRLDTPTRSRLERLLGRNLTDVRVHTGERAQQAAQALGAQAFSLGEKDVFFGSGTFQPDSRSGIGLLAHEVAHTTEATAPGGAQVGFKGAPSASGRGEQFAEAAEQRVLAQEDAAIAAAPGEGSPDESKSSSEDDKKKKYLDATYIEALAWDRFRQDVRAGRDREGAH